MKALNKTLKNIISLIPFSIMIYLIFFFSGQDGETSGGLSGRITLQLMSIINKLFHKGFSASELAELATFWEFYVRKAAHVSEYALLTFTVFLPITEFSTGYRKNLATEASIFALSKIKKKSKYHMEKSPSLNVWERVLITVPATVLLAALDELHQYYVPGRCGIYTDVFIDSIGIAATTLLIIIIHFIHSLTRAKSTHSSNVSG